MAHNTIEKLPLKDQIKEMLEEARVVLPGIQALFGSQLIAVFNSGFEKLLTDPEKRLPFWAIAMTAASVATIMSPAALQRMAQPDAVSERLIKMCTCLLTFGMAPLIFAIPIDFYL